MRSMTLKVLSLVLASFALSNGAQASGDYGVGNGGDQLDWAPRHSCPHRSGECGPTRQGELAEACVSILTNNGHQMDADRTMICMQTASWYGIEALRYTATRNSYIYDYTLRALVSITTPEGVSCVNSLTANHFLMSDGTRAAICAKTGNRFAVEAIEITAKGSPSIDDQTLSALTRIYNRRGVECVRSLVTNHLPMDRDRVEICSQVKSEFANTAIQAAATKNGYIWDYALRAMAQISNRWAGQCVQILIDNGFSISDGSRAAICSTFCSPNQTATLSAIARSNREISDSTLESIARMR